MAKRGDTFTGSFSYNTGTQNEGRYIFTDAAGQAAKTLISSSSGPLPVTVPAMIKADLQGRANCALHIKTVKTVSGQSDIDFAVKRLFFWGGGDETHWCNLDYQGPGANGLHARCGSIAVAYGMQLDFHAAQFVLNDSAVNAEGSAFVNFTASAESPWVAPYGIIGVILFVQTAASPTITTSNTWTIELTWFFD